MRKSKRITSILLSASILFSLSLSSCDLLGMRTNSSSSSKKEETANEYTVTFDYNYEGAPASYVTKVEAEGVAEPPVDPERENYKFDEWYNDSACTKKADFEWAIEADTTFYAGWIKTGAIITFDPNYDGAELIYQNVTLGSTVLQPTDPEREGWLFGGWYTSKTVADENKYDFTSLVNGEMTLYAKWEEVTEEDDTITVSYRYNYEGSGEYYSATIKTGRRPSKPGDPKREGYYFGGWYADTECKNMFNFSQALENDATAYAKWLKTYTFEAEYTNLNGKEGSGYSGESGGTDLINSDRGGKLGQSIGQAGASNGLYLASLYQTGLSIDFVINAEEAVDNAVLELRLSVEYFDKKFNPDLFAVEVNGVPYTYDEFVLSNAVSESEVSSKGIRPFTNHLITKALKLQKGENVIKLIVTNDIDRGGTMFADAPAIDCLYIHSDAALTWTPKEDNAIGRI